MENFPPGVQRWPWFQSSSPSNILPWLVGTVWAVDHYILKHWQFRQELTKRLFYPTLSASIPHSKLVPRLSHQKLTFLTLWLWVPIRPTAIKQSLYSQIIHLLIKLQANNEYCLVYLFNLNNIRSRRCQSGPTCQHWVESRPLLTVLSCITIGFSYSE